MPIEDDPVSPVGRCPYCHELIYEPYCDHCDKCEAFKRRLEEWKGEN